MTTIESPSDTIVNIKTVQIPEHQVQTNSGSIVSLMQSTFMTKEPETNSSLHDRAIKLPFYKRLKSNKITDVELLQHFVNLSSIVSKLETYIKADKSFCQIFSEKIYRTPPIEKDIQFFQDSLKLQRPGITKETREYLEYIDQIIQENPSFLMPLVYVQYAGLFLGRVVCNATINWLKTHVKNWKDTPLNNEGISYWDYKSTPEELTKVHAGFLAGLESYYQGTGAQQPERIREIAKKAFEHNSKSIESVTKRWDKMKAQNLRQASEIRQVVWSCLIMVAVIFILKQIVPPLNEDF